eukprot:3628143-Rhodomonas_salina.6
MRVGGSCSLTRINLLPLGVGTKVKRTPINLVPDHASSVLDALPEAAQYCGAVQEDALGQYQGVGRCRARLYDALGQYGTWPTWVEDRRGLFRTPHRFSL